MTSIFANKVRKILHKKIKGYSNCWIQNDVLIADIQLKGGTSFILNVHILQKAECNYCTCSLPLY